MAERAREQSIVAGRAAVIGSGPNGLSAAIRLAQAGLAVDVFEAQTTPGGAVRTLSMEDLAGLSGGTAPPGYRCDVGSSVHPMAVASPFFQSLQLEALGLHWVHAPLVLTHPLVGAHAAVLERGLEASCAHMGADAGPWHETMTALLSQWEEFARYVLAPIQLRPTAANLRFLRFAMEALQPVTTLARRFKGEPMQALLAGLGAHSGLALSRTATASFALVLGAAAHAVGWPFPQGGAGRLTRALLARLEQLGGRLHLGQRIEGLEQLEGYGLVMADVAPAALLRIAGKKLPAAYKRALERFRPGCGAMKLDYALTEPIPWRARECRSAATVHVGGSFAEIAEAEFEVSRGRLAPHPFVLVAQHSLFDPDRAPRGCHTAWMYCHVPNGYSGSSDQVVAAMENQMERYAPGFKDCVLGRVVQTPAVLERANENLRGGDVGGGDVGLSQLLFRPTRSLYRTPVKSLYLCSASTPPGGGVHGMCGYHAAEAALEDRRHATY